MEVRVARSRIPCGVVALLVSCGGGAGPVDPGPSSSPLEIVTTDLPDAEVSVAFTAQLVAEGGRAPWAWAVASGALPDGLTLEPEGRILGTPTRAGTQDFVVEVSDAAESTATRALSIVVRGDALEIRTASLASVMLGAEIALVIEARGGTSTGFTWSVDSSDLPAGVELEPDGTPSTRLAGTPTEAGDFAFTVAVEDDAGARAAVDLTLTVTTPSLEIEDVALPGFYVGEAVMVSIGVDGGLGGAVEWSVVDGALPNGLALVPDARTVTIAGVPERAGRASFRLAATDPNGVTATRALDTEVYEALTIALDVFSASATVAVPYLARLRGEGGAPGLLTFTVTDGALPDGLSLAPQLGRVEISGTPSVRGTFTFEITVSDSNAGTGSVMLVIDVAHPLTIDQASLPAGVFETPYSSTLTTSGGSGSPATWSITSGALPDGLSLSPTAGVIEGVPTSPGTFEFEVSAQSSGDTASRPLSIRVVPPIVIDTAQIPGRAACAPGLTTLTASGGSGSGQGWSVAAGALPPGWVLSAGGRLYGRSDAAGAHTFTLRVTDDAGATDERTYAVTLTSSPQVPTYAIFQHAVGSGGEVSRVNACRTAQGAPTRLSPAGPSTARWGDPVLSPDGTKVGFFVDPTTSGNFGAYVVSTTLPSPTPTNLLPAPARTFDMAWSPDSSRLAFAVLWTSTMENNLRLVDVTPTGTLGPGSTTFTNAGGVRDLFFSPDSSRVVFGVTTTSSPLLHFADLLGSPVTKQVITPYALFFPVAWSPDQTKLPFATMSTFQYVDFSTDPPSVQTIDSAGRGAVWSFAPGGAQRIVFERRTASSNALFVSNLINGAFGPPTPLLPAPSDSPARNPSWNPQGTQVAFCAATQAAGRDDLYLVDVRGALPATPVLISDPTSHEARCASAAWSPDGSKIAYVGRTGTSERVWVASVSQGGASAPAVASPVPGGAFSDLVTVIWSSDGQRVFTEGYFRGAEPEPLVADVSGAPPYSWDLLLPSAPTAGFRWRADPFLPDGQSAMFPAEIGGQAGLYVVDFLPSGPTAPYRLLSAPRLLSAKSAVPVFTR